MAKLAPYAKFVNYLLIAVVGSIGAGLFDGHRLSGTEALNVLVLLATSALVYLKRNTPTQPWAKTAVAVAGAVVTVFAAAATDGRIDGTEVAQIVLAFLGALQVGVVANVPPGPQPEATADAGPASVVEGNGTAW